VELSSYSPAVREVLADDRLLDLGPGRPNEKMRKRLAVRTAQDLFLPEKVRRADFADSCRAALWLYHDFLAEAHDISQSIATVEGSYWHGIMHRREPDASNAAYWFRRVGNHGIFEELAREAHDLGLQLGSEHWDAFEFIELCEKHRGTGAPVELLLRRVQRREWELLFDWCWRRACRTDFNLPGISGTD
jgi:hypothetical protein